MKLLYVTESVPNRHPELGDGSSMIPFEVLLNLPEDVKVTLLTFAGPVDLPAKMRDRCDSVHVLPIRQPAGSLTRSVFSTHDVGTQQRATRRAVRQAKQLSAASDAALIHGPHVLFLASHILAPMVLQTVDPWSIRVGMESSLCTGWRASYRARKSGLILNAERRLPAQARLLTVGARDASEWALRLGRPVRSIANGAESMAQPVPKQRSNVVCFVGSLNYAPNIASVEVLIGKVAPLVWKELPETRFVVAGRQPSAEVLSWAGPRVEVMGNVSSVAQVFQRAQVAAFPDEYGVGIRNSVREALAAGLPVVATPVAAREQEAHPLLTVEKDIYLFVRQIIRRLTSELSPISGEANQRTWADVAQDYLGELREAIAGSSVERPTEDFEV